ncbi:MAG TPA: hypothetical protein VKW70_04015 [Terriglobia bacterium]|nr:hypothetical protein [Terriglobia bacterium]
MVVPRVVIRERVMSIQVGENPASMSQISIALTHHFVVSPLPRRRERAGFLLY